MPAKTTAFHAMHLQEIEDRAWLFFNLKRNRGYARKRIMQNLRWEFEHAPSAALEKKVDEILGHVYKG